MCRVLLQCHAPVNDQNVQLKTPLHEVPDAPSDPSSDTSIAAEVASRGITVNCIAPGFIKTPMTDKLTDDQQDKILKNIPISRLGLPSDVASACIYLSSDEASFVTGTTLHVNGGMGMF